MGQMLRKPRIVFLLAVVLACVTMLALPGCSGQSSGVEGKYQLETASRIVTSSSNNQLSLVIQLFSITFLRPLLLPNLAPSVIGIATGDSFADALSGSAALGARGGVLVLTPKSSLHSATEAHLQAHVANKPSVEILGGTSAVSASVENEVRKVFGY